MWFYLGNIAFEYHLQMSHVSEFLAPHQSNTSSMTSHLGVAARGTKTHLSCHSECIIMAEKHISTDWQFERCIRDLTIKVPIIRYDEQCFGTVWHHSQNRHNINRIVLIPASVWGTSWETNLELWLSVDDLFHAWQIVKKCVRLGTVQAQFLSSVTYYQV